MRWGAGWFRAGECRQLAAGLAWSTLLAGLRLDSAACVQHTGQQTRRRRRARLYLVAKLSRAAWRRRSEAEAGAMQKVKASLSDRPSCRGAASARGSSVEGSVRRGQCVEGNGAVRGDRRCIATTCTSRAPGRACWRPPPRCPGGRRRSASRAAPPSQTRPAGSCEKKKREETNRGRGGKCGRCDLAARGGGERTHAEAGASRWGGQRRQGVPLHL